jgi:hypothetical protein
MEQIAALECVATDVIEQCWRVPCTVDEMMKRIGIE